MQLQSHRKNTMSLKKILCLLFSLFHLASHADKKYSPIKVKIINKTNKSLCYAIDNFKYLDDSRAWKSLFATEIIYEIADYTSKYGYLELQIRDISGNLVASYIPSGNNTEVTIIINDDKELPKVTRYVGLRDL